MSVVDMHCDTVSRLLGLRREGKAETLRENTGHLDLLRMRQGNYLLQNFALFVRKVAQACLRWSVHLVQRHNYPFPVFHSFHTFHVFYCNAALSPFLPKKVTKGFA